MFRLTNSMVHPEEVDKRELNWYSCGPTIYKRAHLGHARTFLTIDLIQRTMKRFGYKITHLMNITDIDDKILHRLIHRRFERWLKNLSPEPREKIIRQMERDLTPGEDGSITLTQQVGWIQKNSKLVPMGNVTAEEYFEFIDKMENHFWNDMKRLGMNPPDIIQRVSDNILEIIKYIQVIMDRDYAYSSNGSVYFRSEFFTDTKASALAPEIDPDDDFVKDKEFVKEKKTHADFALWKKARPFEIAFDSPWGQGRPGWHIECSTMIEKIFGEKLDVHAGGIDLKFPHHHNEYLQHLAHSDSGSWATWWFHIGHLLVGKEKMSQSLNNGQTIDQFLSSGGQADNLRALFLFSTWNKGVTLTKGAIENAERHLRIVHEFLNYSAHLDRSCEGTVESFGPKEKKFRERQYAQIDRFESLLNAGFQTTEAMVTLLEHIHECYVYGREKEFNHRLIVNYGNYVRSWFHVWGFSLPEAETRSEMIVPELIDLIVGLRDHVRLLARETKKLEPKETMKRLFQISDKIRDEGLAELGIELQDRKEGEATKWGWASSAGATSTSSS